jgi:hypothetical protein
MPRLPIKQLLHASERQAKLVSNFLFFHTLKVQRSSLNHLSLCQDGLVITFSSGRPAFGDHVSKIVTIGSVDNMARIVASAIVASMASVMDGILAMRDLVRFSMQSLGYFYSRKFDVAISPALTDVKRPDQTLIGIVRSYCSKQVLIVSFSARLGWHRCPLMTAVFGASAVYAVERL